MSFPTKENPQLCKNDCGTKIYLSDKKQKGRYLPYELSDIVHDCPNKPSNGNTNTKQETPTQQTSEREAKIARVIKMVESVIFELEDLKKEK